MRPVAVSGNQERLFSEFWRDRLAQHTTDTYRGRVLAKMPEDLRVYQHLIEEARPEVIVELGTYEGGSAIWFADQLTALCGGGRVLTVETEPRRGIRDRRVKAFVGSHQDPGIAAEIAHICRGKRVLVSEDSSHTYDSTLSALMTYADLVSPGSWYVVEDGVVDEPTSIWPEAGGVQVAVREFLATDNRFTPYDLAVYGLTTNTGGWLRRKKLA